MKTGLLGGTFDPVHNGHLAIAEKARKTLALERIVFIPCGIPPHKPPDAVLPAGTRKRMLEIAVAGHPDYSISDFEITRPEKSYTIDTIRYFRAETEKKDLFFIIGADSLYGLYTWKDVDELVTLCEFVVVVRPGFDLAHLRPGDVRLTEKTFSQCVNHVLEMQPVTVSSSEIKQLISRGESINGMVPDLVEKYIRAHNLYKDQGKKV